MENGSALFAGISGANPRIRAFFDRAGAFIRRLHDDFAPHRIAIGVDAEAENICLCKQGDLPSSVSFHNGAALIADVDKRKVTKPGYLHAKALFLMLQEGIRYL